MCMFQHTVISVLLAVRMSFELKQITLRVTSPVLIRRRNGSADSRSLPSGTIGI